MIQKQNYISLEKRKVFDTPSQTTHPKTSQTTFGFGNRPKNVPTRLSTLSGIAPNFPLYRCCQCALLLLKFKVCIMPTPQKNGYTQMGATKFAAGVPHILGEGP